MSTHPLSDTQIHDLVAMHGSPLYVYTRSTLEERARQLIHTTDRYTILARYAVKANPHPEIIRMFMDQGIQFDVSSSYEADYLLSLGVSGEKISLSSQQPAHDLDALLNQGVRYIATSLHQLELYAATSGRPSSVGLRVNTGYGSGHNNRTKTAGTTASFGLWHEYVDEALAYCESQRITITTLHTHIGSGGDSSSWAQAIDAALDIARNMPDVHTLDMGGGYKVARSDGEEEADMRGIMSIFAEHLDVFAKETGRVLHLEIEPGTWLVAHAGCLITEITDIVDTGLHGFTFLRTNTGMNDFLRPTLYGAQHSMHIVNDSLEQCEYIVVGHNCESGDILTTAKGDPETIEPRRLNKANIGDLLVVADVGAYGASLRAKGYNAYPDAKEVVIEK